MPPKPILVKCPECGSERMARPPRMLCVPCRNRMNSPLGAAARSAASDQRTKNPLYHVWKEMRARCYRKTHPRYARYGGRGISVCLEWQSWEAFRDWSLDNGWKPGLHLDRKENDGHYEPGNCEWLERSEHTRKTWRVDRRPSGRPPAGGNAERRGEPQGCSSTTHHPPPAGR